MSNVSDPSIIVAVVIGLLLISLLWIAYRRYKKSIHCQITTILRPYIRDEIKHIIIPDGIGGLIEVEHLVLIDQGLLLIETYPVSGNLFGSDKMNLWSQVIDGRSYKFANPLPHIYIMRQALQVLAPGIPIFCRIIFNADSVFPKGKPEEVSVLKSLENDMLTVRSSAIILDKSRQAWNQIMRIARKDGKAVQQKGTGND